MICFSEMGNFTIFMNNNNKTYSIYLFYNAKILLTSFQLAHIIYIYIYIYIFIRKIYIFYIFLFEIYKYYIISPAHIIFVLEKEHNPII